MNPRGQPGSMRLRNRSYSFSSFPRRRLRSRRGLRRGPGVGEVGPILHAGQIPTAGEDGIPGTRRTGVDGWLGLGAEERRRKSVGLKGS
jgi:hypothetical protein